MLLNKKQIYLLFLTIVLISTAMHFKHFNKELIGIHVWRQTQTQSTINNFYEEDMNIFNPHRNERGNTDGIYRMEFPLMQWLVACTYKVVGNSLVITRVFMYIIGLLSVAGMYKLIKNMFNNTTIAIIAAWAFNFSPSFYYYTINPIPDNLSLCTAIWGLTLFIKWLSTSKNYLLYLSALFFSIATLCKLPFVVYFSFPLSYLFFNYLKNKQIKTFVLSSFPFIMAMLLPAIWYYKAIPTWHGNGVVLGVFDNNPGGNQLVDYLLHNLISTLPELLLNYASLPLFLAGIYFIVKYKTYQHKLFLPFVVLSSAVLFYFFFEINMIAKIHDYYLFPFYPLLFIIVSYGIYNLLKLNNKIATAFVYIALLVLPFTCYLRMKKRWNIESPGFNSDLLKYKNELRSAVPYNALCIVGKDESRFIYFYYIDKKGWSFANDSLIKEEIENRIENGAQYLYSDSRQIDSQFIALKHIDTLIVEKGSIKVFKLK